MQTEELKNLFSLDSFDNLDYVWSKTLKKALKRNLKIIQQRAENTNRRDDKAVWLKENAPFLLDVMKDIKLKDFFCRNDIFFSVEKLIQTSSFEAKREELIAFFEVIDKKIGFMEKELTSLRSVFLFLITKSIRKSVENNLEHIDRYFTLFHRIKSEDFEYFATVFSPIERIFRFDPAGIYPSMTRQSQRLYKSRLIFEARKKKTDPLKLAKEKFEEAKKKGEHIGFFLVEKKRKCKPIYFSFALFFLLLIEFLISFPTTLPVLLLALPLYFFSKRLVEYVFSLLTKPEILPSVKLEKISKDQKTCVVIAGLITSKKDVDNLCEKIFEYKINNSNSDDELYFGLLCDLKESKNKVLKEDRELIAYLDEKICQMNLADEKFFAVLRKRTFHASEGMWVGYERKRGAIEQFVSYLSEKGWKDGYLFGCFKRIVGSVFLITLDADTRLSIGQAKRLIGVASHPLNRPVIGKRYGRSCVVSGYGVLQPKIVTSLQERIITPFGKIYGNGSGDLLYATAGFDAMQTFYKEGNFCGKGLIDVKAYEQILPGQIPEQKILSHDMPEGALLRSALLINEYFSDSNPQTTVSFYKRQHRWIRGDIQNLLILNKLSNLRKFFAIENILSYLVPCFEYLALIVSSFLGKTQAVVCALLILLFHAEHLLFTASNVLLSGNISIVFRHFSTKMRNLFLNGFYQFVLSIGAITQETVWFLDAISKGLYRMIVSKRKLLEWQVFSPVSADKPFFFFLPSLLLSIVSVFLANNPITLLIFLICSLFPFVSLHISTPYKVQSGFSAEQKNFLREKAKKEFLFFQECIGPHTANLPPDNIQLEPTEKIAMRTSPTNIGLYLASLAAAKELDLITEKDLTERSKAAIASIEKLERWNGHLFNWYDLKTLEVIGDRFVSTVDSGNYIAGVIVLLQTVKALCIDENDKAELIEKLESEINKPDFFALYQPERNLFRVGVFPDEDNRTASNYDLYMSEARITAYLSVSLGMVPVHHWKCLSRPLLSFRGRVGIGSWSGTAFEYFMPPLFLPVIENSLEDETLEYALYSQMSYGAKISPRKSVFGISESGYSLTDISDNYQYKAFGVPYLSIQPDKNVPKVISPYASFLMLERQDERVLSNLKALSEIGMEGDFGYFEACEFHSNFIGDYTLVCSYMAHHKGMSVLALANAICDKIIQKRFISFDHFQSKTQLLAERFPLEDKVLKKKKQRISHPGEKDHDSDLEMVYEIQKQGQHSNLITDGKISLLSYNNGTTRLIWRGMDLFDPEKSGLRLRIQMGDSSFLLPGDESEKSNVVFGLDYVEYTFYLKKAQIHWRMEFISSLEAVLCRLRINGHPGPCTVTLEFDAVIQKLNEFESHPAFHALSLEASMDKNRFLIRKRGVEHHRYLHFVSDQNFRACVQGKAPEALFSDRMLLSPNVVLQFDYDSASSINTALVLAPSVSEVISNPFLNLDGEFNLRSEVKKRSVERCSRFQRLCCYDRETMLLESRILNAIKEKRLFYHTDEMIPNKKDFFWQYGVSGDVPIITCFVRECDQDSLTLLEKLLCVCKKIHFSGLSFDFVVLHERCYEYFNPLREKLTDLVSKLQCEFLIGKHPGVHFVAYTDQKDRRVFESAALLSYFKMETDIKPIESKMCVPIQRHHTTKSSAEKIGEVNGQCFTLDKSKYDPKIPLSHIVSNRVCGFVCDQRSLGFTWHRNAGLNRISKWDSNPDQNSGEKLFWSVGDRCYDLLQMAHIVKFQRHFAIYEGQIGNVEYQIVATVSEMIAGKIIFLSFSGDEKISGDLIYSFIPSLGSGAKGNVQLVSSEKTVRFSPTVSGEYPGMAYLFSKNNIKSVERNEDRLSILSPVKKENLLCLGGYSSQKHLDFIENKLVNLEMEELLEKEKTFSDTFFPKQLDRQMFWIRYQTVHSRFFGRTGLYQSSGAYGFRDQLQDSLAFLKFAPEYTKLQILRAASHQFQEGDVQHWWHTIYRENTSHPGIRSRCSDDYLWLLFATAEYIEKTADTSILNIRAPFLVANPLKQNQSECYLTAQIGERCVLSEHLKRAVNLFLERGLGPNNLPFIGSGDWNDGMNQLSGESVWLGFFATICLHRTKEYFDDELQKEIALVLKKMSEGLTASFRGAWYPRVFCSDGSVIGSDISIESECSIDLITQAFSALCYLETKMIDPRQVKTALLSAYDLLYSPKYRTVKLFTPPFVNRKPSPGYIQRYCAGVRENGGQYTHAAIWFAIALLRFGNACQDKTLVDKGLEVAKSLSPFANLDVELFLRYQREPYVLCGDIYMANGLLGHGGWSWYTGAAGWYLKLLDEVKKEEKKKIAE